MVRPEDAKGFPVPPFAPGDIIANSKIVEVLKSDHESFKVGDMLIGVGYIEEFSTMSAAEAAAYKSLDNPANMDPKLFLGVLGGVGLAGYSSLLEIGKPEKGQTILVSAAAGPVGQMAGQVAKLHELRVVGVVGQQLLLPEPYKTMHTSKTTPPPAIWKSTKTEYDVFAAIEPDMQSKFWNPMSWPAGHARHPPAYIQACGMDLLRDDALVFEHILRKDYGISTKLDIYEGLPHGFWINYPTHSKSGQYILDTLKGVGWLLGRTDRFKV